MKSPAERLQDDIYRRMSPDRKLDVASELWRLGKELAPGKITYGTQRPADPARGRDKH